MKKLIFSFAFIVLLSSAAMAQVKFGLKAGAMLSNTSLVETDTIENLSETKISYLVGGFMNIPINSKLSIQPELLYANKGSENFHKHYVNLPIMLQYELIDGLSIEVGPEIGYLLGSYSQWYYLNGDKAGTRRRYDTKDFDLGINVGASYALLDRLSISLRYNMGIIDTYTPKRARFDFGTPIGLPDYNIQNRTLQLSVGWKLGK